VNGLVCLQVGVNNDSFLVHHLVFFGPSDNSRKTFNFH